MNTKYLIIFSTLLNLSNFYAADINDIDIELVDEYSVNIKNDEYPNIYQILGEQVNEFNAGDINKKYSVVYTAFAKVKSKILKREYNLEKFYKINDEFSKLVEELQETNQLTDTQSINLNQSLIDLNELTNTYV